MVPIGFIAFWVAAAVAIVVATLLVDAEMRMQNHARANAQRRAAERVEAVSPTSTVFTE